jgi:hypothetical protein
VAIKNRFLELTQPSATLNGIDFVEVIEAAPLDLRVHFINAVAVDGPSFKPPTITGGDSVPDVKVASVAAADWSTDADGRPLLTLHALGAGDFSNYRLTLSSDTLDPFYASAIFSFKVFCPSDFDCAPLPVECPPDDIALPPIDYLAKDFGSFRRALSDFSALRYPDWQERGEGDLGVMFLEALSALGDDLSYQQDRVAAEATLDTATERRSIVRHARLVDYDPLPARSARTWLVCEVNGTVLPAGIEVSASDPEGGVVPFEIGTGLYGVQSCEVDPKWNALDPYWWDDSEQCLRRGATGMWVTGGNLALKGGQILLIETQPATSADPPLRQLVKLVKLNPTFEKTDALFGPTTVTHVEWELSDALKHDHDLTRQTKVYGNVVPATQGRRRSESFAIGQAPPAADQMPLAFARLGANATADKPRDDYRYTPAETPIAWLAQDDPEKPPVPEIRMQRAGTPPESWNFAPHLFNLREEERAFCLEPARYRRIAVHPDGAPQLDYNDDAGETILFGNGTFGAVPESKDVFEVTYRVGLGARGNVASDTINVVDPAWTGLLQSLKNPFPAEGGADRETGEQVRRRAPQAFQARQFRAVRAEDYETETERLAWVQQAGTAFRWTGSWFTVFTAVDPKGGEVLPLDRHTEVINLLNRRRLAGYESYVPKQRYVSIDLAIDLCAKPEAFQGDVERDVLAQLAPAQRDVAGFFFADRFTFGTPLERSQVEAAIQGVPGVAGVLSIRYRRRGFVPSYVELPDELPLGIDEILRIDNDRNHPERGSVAVNVYGGK